jgi:hypothetical protein
MFPEDINPPVPSKTLNCSTLLQGVTSPYHIDVYSNGRVDNTKGLLTQGEQDMNWDTSANNTISRAEAQVEIVAKAQNEGINGAFKVFYDGELVVTPSDLPEQVDMNKVRVSAVLDQA